MKLDLFSIWKRRSCAGLKKRWGWDKIVFFFMFFSLFFWAFGETNICHASGKNIFTTSKKDKVIDESTCRVPGSYTVGLRDMPLGIHYIDTKKGWIVGNFGLGLSTRDGGKSWHKVPFSDEESFKDIFFVGDKGWIVGERGIILHTDDSGVNWKKQSAVNKTFLSVFFINDNKGFIVGGDGTVLKTNNAGTTWQIVSFDWDNLISEELLELGVVSVNLYDVFFITETLGWIVGDAGTVLRTSDGGNQWSVTHMGALPPLFSISFRNEKDGFAVGSHGYCLKSSNSGRSWDKFKIGTENSLYRVTFYKDYGVAVGDLATIIKTIDGGKTWVNTPSNIPPPYPWFADVCILPDYKNESISIVGKSIIFNTKIISKK